MHRPRLILADEPTGNLDPATAERVLSLLVEQVREHGAACLLVTHSRAAAARADRSVTLTPTGIERLMLALLRQLSWPELRHHPWRNAAALLAVMLGVALAFSVHLINASALAEFGAAVRAVNGEADLALRRPARAASTSALRRASPRAPGVAVASPVVEAETFAFDAAGARVPIRLVGIDALVVGHVAPALLPRPARRRPTLLGARPRRGLPQRRRRATPRRRGDDASRCRPPPGGARCASPAASPPAGRRSP